MVVKPLFSIITVCLNARDGIIKTARSIQNQENRDFEWIVIDGGSTDGTLEFLEKEKSITHLVSEKDGGIYNAMNKGIRLSSGQYYLFLNAGDFLLDYKVLLHVQKYLKADIVVGQIKQEGHADSSKNGIKNFDTQLFNQDYLYYRSLPHPSTFIRRDIFRLYGGYEESFKIAGDHDFFARTILSNVSLCFAPVCISEHKRDGINAKMKGTHLFSKELEKIRRRNFSLLFRWKRKILDKINIDNIIQNISELLNG